MPSTVTCRVEGGVAQVRLNRPDKLNALTLDTLEDLVTTARDLSRDRTLRGVVIGGEGESFCAGLDFATVLKNPPRVARSFVPNPLRGHQPVPGGLLGLAPGAGAGRGRRAGSLLRRRRCRSRSRPTCG